MREELQKICDTFKDNREIIRKAFSFENDGLYSLCAAIFTDRELIADLDKLRMCRDILKANTGVFSNFRGNVKLPMISILAASDEPENKMLRTVEIHKILRESFHASEYLPIAAMTLDEMPSSKDYRVIAARSKNIYTLMKKEHPFLTSAEDSVLSVLMALSDNTDEVLLSRMEKSYVRLKKVFPDSNAVQTISHIIALMDDDIEKNCDRTVELYRKLRQKGLKYGKSNEVSILALLSVVEDMDAVVEDIAEVDSFLSQQKGYGFCGLSKSQRLMHAAILVSKLYLSETDKQIVNASFMGSTVSLIIAEQTVLMTCVIASTTAANASN